MAWHFECWTCERTFSSWQARENHCDSKGHSAPDYECDRCDRYFNSANARFQHMERQNHFEYDCHVSSCYETWPDETQRKEHEIDDHCFCQPCDRFFNNRNNIQAHLRSRTHMPAGSMCCPFCDAPFTSATGVAHHLERAACPKAPTMNRDTLYEYVRAKDPSGSITKNLIGWYGSDEYEATERSWNGQNYQCYLCSKTFPKLSSLNAHLKSPRHQQVLYHCPKCRKDFTTLGGLINHLESEACGHMRFNAVQTTVDNLIRRGRLLT